MNGNTKNFVIVHLTHLTIYYLLHEILKIIYFKKYSMDKINDNAIQFFFPWQSFFSVDTNFQNILDKWTCKIFITRYFVPIFWYKKK